MLHARKGANNPVVTSTLAQNWRLVAISTISRHPAAAARRVPRAACGALTLKASPAWTRASAPNTIGKVVPVRPRPARAAPANATPTAAWTLPISDAPPPRLSTARRIIPMNTRESDIPNPARPSSATG